MAEAKQSTVTPAAKAEHLRYDVHNPTRALRVVYDGIEGRNVAVSVLPGETKKGVLLHGDIVKELRERNKTVPNSDLKTKLCEPEKSDA